MPQQNAELFTLTYGSIVRQLLVDHEDNLEAVNTQLEKMYRTASRPFHHRNDRLRFFVLGQRERLVRRWHLSRAGVGGCGDVGDTTSECV